MQAYRGIKVYVQSFLAAALDEGKLSSSRSGRFTPDKKQRYALNKRLAVFQGQSKFVRREKFTAPKVGQLKA
jgi:hypothetical protein